MAAATPTSTPRSNTGMELLSARSCMPSRQGCLAIASCCMMQKARMSHIEGWMQQMANLPSRPDLLLLEDSECGPGGKVLGFPQLSRLHSVRLKTQCGTAKPARRGGRVAGVAIARTAVDEASTKRLRRGSCIAARKRPKFDPPCTPSLLPGNLALQIGNRNPTFHHHIACPSKLAQERSLGQ